MTLRLRRLVVGFVVGLSGLSTLVAHETWLMPSAFFTRVGEEIRLDLSSGMAFPRLESPIRPSRVANASFRLAGETGELSRRDSGASSLVFRQRFRGEGVATVWLDLKPKEIELTDDVVAEYLDEIDASAEIRATWAGLKGHVPWRETYTKHAKSFVTVGNAGDDTSWKDATGAALEIVPAFCPCAAAVGQELTVEVRRHGAPLTGLPVGLLVESRPDRIFRTTDGRGLATFPSSPAGRALFFVVRLEFDRAKKAWSSDFATITVDLRESR
jgi:uncharacterized GH25 family protein